MNLRPYMKATVAALICAAVIVQLAGCGGGKAGITEALDPSAYAQTMLDWFETNWAGNFNEGEEAAFDDPLNPTQAEIERLRQFADKLQASVALLQAIVPPEEIGRVHRQFVADWTEQVELLGQMADFAAAGDIEAMADAATRSMDVIESDANYVETLGYYIDAHISN